MSSEAAQKAYPEEPVADLVMRVSRESQRVAFDRGAVEALRQAADMVRRASLLVGPDWIDRMADDWERGSA